MSKDQALIALIARIIGGQPEQEQTEVKSPEFWREFFEGVCAEANKDYTDDPAQYTTHRENTLVNQAKAGFSPGVTVNAPFDTTVTFGPDGSYTIFDAEGNEVGYCDSIDAACVAYFVGYHVSECAKRGFRK